MGESFRVKKGFTIVQNSVARDLELSEKALGLYVRIQCWITLPDPVSKSFLMAHCNGREKAFDSSWKELQHRGYLKTYQYRSSNAVTFDTEHELLETAEPDTPYFYIVSKPSNRLSTVWYYSAGQARTKNGLCFILTGDRVEHCDRVGVRDLLGSPPQNGGTCSGTTTASGTSLQGDTLNTILNTIDNTSYNPYSYSCAGGDGPGIYAEELPGITESALSVAKTVAAQLYARYSMGVATRADEESVLRCITVREEGEARIEQEKILLLGYAFDRAREAGKPGNWNYINGVLGKLSERKITTLEQAEAFDAERIQST